MTASTFWSDVGVNLFSSFLYTIMIAIAVVVVSILVLRREQRRLFSVFGLDPDQPSLRIFVSRVDVLPAGSRGTDGRTALGFVGPALVHLEYSGALEVEKLFGSAFLNVLPDFLKRIVQRQNGGLRDVDVEIDVSPGPGSTGSVLDRGAAAVLLVGSDVYSPAVRSVYRGPESFITFVCEANGELFDASDAGHGDPTFAVAGTDGWHTVGARTVGREIGTIQRLHLGSGRQVMMCAGISAASTVGAMRYLCANWRSIYRRFGRSDFLIVLSFGGQQADDAFVVNPEELPDLERQRPERVPRQPTPRRGGPGTRQPAATPGTRRPVATPGSGAADATASPAAPGQAPPAPGST